METQSETVLAIYNRMRSISYLLDEVRKSVDSLRMVVSDVAFKVDKLDTERRNRKDDEYYTMQELCSKYGYSKAGIYLLIKDGVFPSQIKVGKRAVRFIADEVHAVMNARAQGKSVGEVRAIVRSIEAARK